MKIATKKGDFGKTDTATGRIEKHSPLMECLGQLDICIAETIVLAANYPHLKEKCQRIVEDCSLICAILTHYQPNESFAKRTEWLDKEIEEVSKNLQYQFIYPYDNLCAACINRLRTYVRTTERALWRLHLTTPIDQEILSYLNRLSDFWYGECCKELERTDQA